jgi:hypothetical protein
MGATSFFRPAREEEVDGTIVTKRTSLKRDMSGRLVKFIEFIEDDDNSSVSSRTINSDAFNEAVVTSAESSLNLVVEDLAPQISPEFLGPYVLTKVPKPDTLSIYLNGQLVNDQASISNKEITFASELKEAIAEDSSVYAIYIEEI